MLSKQSFAALLKTLEEPPPHVKFLFATTDPEKLPITVLSRCLQFNLKNLSAERITQHLQFVLEQEKLPFEEPALWALARAADGSMRDALSLTDQAIGHGGGNITEPDVNSMLGTIGRGYAMEICKTLTQGQGSAVLAAVSKMAELSPDYDMVLADMLSIWHQVAILQTVPEALDKGVEHYSEMLELASGVSAEDIQLFYQVCLLGRKDLSLAPDLKSGFEMVVLRALAFRPDTQPPVKNSPELGKQNSPEPADKNSPEPAKQNSPEPAEGATQNASEVAQSAVKKPQSDNNTASQAQALAPSIDQEPLAKANKEPSTQINNEPSAKANKEPSAKAIKEPLAKENKQTLGDQSAEQKQSSPQKIPLQNFSPDNWLQVRKQLDIGASLGEIASHCLFTEKKKSVLFFIIDNQQTSLYDAAHEQGLAEALSDYFGESVTVDIAFGVANRETPRVADNREKAERLAEAVATLNQDPDIIKFKKLFDARLDESSVRPID